MSEPELEGIAIIGVHGRFPGARCVEEFWSNLVAGLETVSLFTDAELSAAGLEPADLRQKGHYVPARGILQDIECFDAGFFGIHPKEAEVMDPQQRVFLEGCWEALERSGYPPGRISCSVGVYAGATFNTFYLHALHPRPELRELVGAEQVMLGNEKDYLATRVAYKLNLRGPAISLNTACSSSLVAAAQACQALLTFQCDIALAGGVSVTVPQQRGYFFQEGNISSPDGHTRTFDAQAQGTVFSNGLSLVVLKRLAEAVRDGDQIWAVIKGAAVNNDGSQRVSFGAPGVEGQAEVISLAQAIAGVDPQSVTYVEAHGTATPLGDPIEVAALTQAFQRGTQRKQFCALGSLKSNVGHLDAAAGTAGLIKTALALRHRLLPPSLHFQVPNPKLDLESSPFFVNARLREWTREGTTPLRAGVSSFGTGGTNAHLVLEEAPSIPPPSPSRPCQFLLLSAKTPEALESATRNLANHLKAVPDLDLADAAFTLQVGRGEFVHRRAILCRNNAEAVARLEKADPRTVLTAKQELRDPPVVFMFPGQGAQYVGMGSEVYAQEPVFREAVDQCARILSPILGVDLCQFLWTPGEGEAEAQEKLRQTRFTQPALFTVEYALAKLWLSWGVTPAAMIGHSVGEYVAACLGGVFGLEEALTLVARRAELVQSQSPGSMLAVRLPEDQIRPLLNGDLSIAAVNSPNLCVVSGPSEAITALEAQLAARGVAGKRLLTSHAFHSAMMEPVVAPFTALLRSTAMSAPQIPYVSNVTARWVTPEDAMSPEYWARHVRQTVRFADGVAELAKDPRRILLEVGPGQTLSQLARQHPGRPESQPVISSLGIARDHEAAGLAAAVARLWLAGVSVDWAGYYRHESRRRVVLPTYPFERKTYWPSGPVTEPVSAPVSRASTSPAQPAGATATSAPQAAEPVPAPDSAIPQVPRLARLTLTVRSLLQDLSGSSLENVDPGTSFLEIGLDSLLLTQAANLFQRKFGVPVSFRQLMEDLVSVESLAEYLDQQLPAEAFAAPAAAPRLPTSPSPSPSTATPGALELGPATRPIGVSQPAEVQALLQQHLEVTHQLIRILAGPGAVVASTAGLTSQAATEVPPAKSPGATSVSAPASRGESKSHGPFRPLDRGSAGGLTSAQQEMLDTLIARYTRRTAGSKRLAAANRAALADPRSASGFKQLWKEMVYPIYTERSDGARVWDVDGNEYVDFVMGFGASLFGHRPPFVVEAIQQQLGRGFEIGPIQPVVGETAALVRELTGMERVAFCNTGSEAVLGAMRLARTVTGRDRIAMFSGAYHGIFDEVLARPATVNGEVRSAPIAPGIPASGVSEMQVFDWGNPDSLERIRRCAHELAAVLVEPVQSRRLDLQPRAFLQELRQITAQSQTALIFDEVVTGFRVHPGGAQAYFDIQADIATYGKVVGGGLPIGVLAGRPRFLDALDGGAWEFGDGSFPQVGVTFFAGTFVRHPITMAAARAVLEHLRREGPALQQRLAAFTERLAARVRELIDRYQAPLHLAQFSSMMYLTVQPQFKHGGLLFYLLRERGIHIYENRAFVLTTAHSDADAEALLKALEGSLQELGKGGFLALPTASRSGSDKAAAAVSISGSAPAQAGTSAVTGKTEFELTEAQREVWLAALLDRRASQSYNITLLLHLDGSLDQPRLERCLQAWVDRHDSLRSSFDLNRPVQRIIPALKISLRVTDKSDVPDAARAAELGKLATAQGEETFDLTRPPLLRLQLVRFATDRHVLMMTYSHLAVDGWSGGVLLHELKLLYAAGESQAGAALEAPLQFAEYQQILQTPDGRTARAGAEEYWKRQFQVLPAALDLPSDRTRPAERSFGAARVSVEWPPEFTQALRKASARQGSTLLTYLLGVFKVLLHRLGGQDDLVVGVPAAGQLAQGLEAVGGSRALVGHCVHLLPVRSECGDQLPFSAFLKGLKRTMLDAFEHQELSFGRLIQLLNVPRDASRVPLVPVIFNLDRAAVDFQLSGLQTRVEEFARTALVFDLSINVVDHTRSLTIDCDFNTDLYDAATIGRWLGHFRRLLQSAMEGPEETIARLRMLDDAEVQQITQEWNQTDVEFPGPFTLTELFDAQVAKTPKTIALVCQDQRLTFQELQRRADLLAGHLRELGIGSEAKVGVCTRRSVEMVVGMLAILKAGGSYIPLDPQYPRDRIQFMLEDAQAPVVLVQRDTVGNLEGHKARTLCLDDFDWQAAPKAVPRTEISPRQLAYVIYTSGSTGIPKGVAIEHRSAAILIHWALGVFKAEELAGVLFSTSICFDLSVFELFVTLSAGGKVILAENALALRDLPARAEVTLINTVPSAMTELVRLRAIPPGVQVVNLAGEPLKTSLVDQIYAAAAVKKVYDLYGPSEDTTYSTWTLRRAGERATIGRPIANTQVYLLDSGRQPVPIGVPGELYIGGDGLAREYLNRPELTAERFLPNPFRNGPGARVYRTGDWARYRPDGNLEFLGRMDQQVKLRGFRIEIGEIEAALGRHPAVRQCVVVVRVYPDDEKRLVAYVEPHSGVVPDTAALRSHLRQTLPEYMQPQHFVLMEQLPLTPNKKIDRKALPPPETAVAAGGAARAGSATPAAANGQLTATERSLAELWQKLLHVPHVDRESDFFDLGGHSLLAVRLFDEIESRFGCKLPLVTILRAATLSALAAAIDSGRVTPADWRSLVAVRAEGSRPPLFCVHGGGGEVLFARDLVRHLDRDQPLYGLQARALKNIAERDTTVEAMAEHYLEEIRSVQPSGPYYLAGFCMGGLVVYEIAQRLLARQELVGLVVLIDTFNPLAAARARLQATPLAIWRGKIAAQWGNLVRLPAADMANYFTRRSQSMLRYRFKRLLGSLGVLAGRLGLASAEHVHSRYLLEDYNDQVGGKYRPGPLDANVLVVRPQGGYRGYDDPAMGWLDLVTGQLEVANVAVNPGGMFVEPYLGMVGDCLSLALSKAQSGTSATRLGIESPVPALEMSS